jgi:K+-transporting ATPase ATPase C chain
MISQLRPALIVLGVLSLLTGVIYPAVVTGIAQIFFPRQANGSLVEFEGNIVGSQLIGQYYDEPGYFWGRLSATAPYPYNASASSGSNLGPSNPALTMAIEDRINDLHAADPQNDAPIPVDLVTASASGLDPHISVAAALYQIPRIARARGETEAEITSLVENSIERRLFGFIGEPRVNVLLLNLALDDALE